MGWCSGTDIFDPVAKFVIYSDLSEQRKYDILHVLIEALENHDWDCEQDSRYWSNPIVQRVMADLNPDWFGDDLSDE